MSKKLLNLYEEALTAIRELGVGVDVGEEAKKIATDALNEGEKDSENDKRGLILKLRNFIILNGLIFDTAEEMSDRLNADGSILTLRDKPWSKASIARLMPEIRASILSATAASISAPTPTTYTALEPAEPATEPNEDVIEDEIEEIKQPMTVPVEVELPEDNIMDELADLEMLLSDS